MSILHVVALLCALGGLLMIWLGYLLSRPPKEVTASIQQAVDNSNIVLRSMTTAATDLAAAPKPETGVGYSSQLQSSASAVSGAADYVKALAELAKNLSNLTPAIAAFLIATVLFFFAVALVSLDRVAPPPATQPPGQTAPAR